MSDLFTTTPPVTVLGVDPFLSANGCGESKKIYIIGGTRYTVSKEQNSGAAPAIMKSATGASWTGPLGTIPSGFSGSTSNLVSIPDAGASKIHFIYHKQASPFHLFYFYFDLGSDSFSTPVDSGVGSTVSVAAQRSNGDIVVASESANGLTMQAAVISGGAWSSWTTLQTATSPRSIQPKGILIDSSDNAHIVYLRPGGASNWFYITFSAGGSAGTEVDTGLTAFGSLGPGLLWNDRLLWPHYSSNLSSPQKMRLLQGETVASPTWTDIDVATLDGNNGGDFSPDIVLVSTLPWVIWSDNDGGVSILQVQTCSYDGTTFGTIYVAYDAVTNPPSGISGEPLGDRLLRAPSVQMTGSFTAEMVVQTDVTYPDEDESLVWLAGVFPGGPPPAGGQMNRFSTSSSYAGIAMP